METVVKGLRAVLYGVFINMILAGIKIISGILGNSYALIADGIESSTDIFSSLVVWGGLKIASRPADQNHPYGHGKAESLAALFVASALLLASAIISVQSIREILTPHKSPATFTLFILAGVVATKEFLFRKIIRLGDESHSTAIKTDAWHHRSDALTSLAAFIGISIAVIGGPGYEMADDWAALVAAGFILYNGSLMLRVALKEIMDTLHTEDLEIAIKKVAESTEGVMFVEKCYIRKSGFYFIVDMHIEVDGNIPVTEGHRIAHCLKDNIMHENRNVINVMVHVEPFVFKNT